MKNLAYAWRQAIFFLSLLDTEIQLALVNENLASGWNTWLAPVVRGLVGILHGDRFDENGRLGRDPRGRRLLGWSVGPHWILEA